VNRVRELVGGFLCPLGRGTGGWAGRRAGLADRVRVLPIFTVNGRTDPRGRVCRICDRGEVAGSNPARVGGFPGWVRRR
jgi:hypothetical protein